MKGSSSSPLLRAPPEPPVLPNRPLSLGHGANVALVAVVVAANLNALLRAQLRLTFAEQAALVGLSILYTLTAFLWRAGGRRGALLYFGVQLLLGGAVLLLSRGYAGMAVLPLVAQSVLVLSTRGVAVFAALLTASATGVLRLFDAPADAVLLLPSAIAMGSASAFVAAFTHVAVGERRARREAQRLALELADAQRRLEENAADAQRLALSEQRNRIARELHDGLGHALTVVHVQVQAARAVLGRAGGTDAPALEALEVAGRQTKIALTELREAVAAFRSQKLTVEGVAGRLRRLAQENGAQFTFEGEVGTCSADQESALFRVAQEALTNATRHAPGAQVRIRLRREGPELALTVEDDGPGATSMSGGFGLVGMRERLEAVGGQITVETEVGAGFRVRAVLPQR